ncbi:hypothetical protein MJO28_011062 [Puccinia striiformis f. sp. tritici]|uniref:Uncharacterized protein n=1 Tax=Puccinia striiformis f. sp. tritici TaxID=168172 RepID=A0ACC0E319_9BASI|nr:hypothetical protein MJO28_011062 [Puccinia striiformis f. sp. tritici]
MRIALVIFFSVLLLQQAVITSTTNYPKGYPKTWNYPKNRGKTQTPKSCGSPGVKCGAPGCKPHCSQVYSNNFVGVHTNRSLDLTIFVLKTSPESIRDWPVAGRFGSHRSRTRYLFYLSYYPTAPLKPRPHAFIPFLLLSNQLEFLEKLSHDLVIKERVKRSIKIDKNL